MDQSSAGLRVCSRHRLALHGQAHVDLLRAKLLRTRKQTYARQRTVRDWQEKKDRIGGGARRVGIEKWCAVRSYTICRNVSHSRVDTSAQLEQQKGQGTARGKQASTQASRQAHVLTVTTSHTKLAPNKTLQVECTDRGEHTHAHNYTHESTHHPAGSALSPRNRGS